MTVGDLIEHRPDASGIKKTSDARACDSEVIKNWKTAIRYIGE